ncbi:hypothetical protein P8452_50620 [Trifolium repens]|nr:hypothetical protein P8452_50620 [Trifolium repens]
MNCAPSLKNTEDDFATNYVLEESELNFDLMSCVDGLLRVGTKISFTNLLTTSKLDFMGNLQFNSNL